jgi:sodium/bile acid cotransporter 7
MDIASSHIFQTPCFWRNCRSLCSLDIPTDAAAAIFNATFGNIVRLFLTPFLILDYIGSSGGVPIGKTIYTLAIRVLLPLFIGQVVRRTSTRLIAFVKKYQFYIDKAIESTLVFIIYTCSFCTTFAKSKHNTNFGDLCFLVLFQFNLLCIAMVLAWTLLQALFPQDPKFRLMGLFGCTEKTLMVGLPRLISAIYAGNHNLGLYTLPLLIW